MNLRPSERLALGWTRLYTAGLPDPVARARHQEIESDLAEHRRVRSAAGHRPARTSREQLTRLARGAHSDIGWRRDVLLGRSPSLGLRRTSVLTVATISSILVAAFNLLFAAFIRGETALADQHYLLGGMHYYDDEVGSSIFAAMLAAMGVALLVATVARPVAPFSANVIAVFLSLLWIMWFWVRMWPVALILVGSSVIDMLLRSPLFDRQAHASVGGDTDLS